MKKNIIKWDEKSINYLLTNRNIAKKKKSGHQNVHLIMN